MVGSNVYDDGYYGYYYYSYYPDSNCSSVVDVSCGDATPVPTGTPVPSVQLAPDSTSSDPTPNPTRSTTKPAPLPTKAPDDNEKKDDDGDGDEEDGPDEGALGIIGDAVIDYWSITKNLFTDIWNHITRN